MDPLDGTKEFIKRNGQFTVNIALAEKGKVILGVVFVPATGELYYASHGNGSFHQSNQGIVKLSMIISVKLEKIL